MSVYVDDLKHWPNAKIPGWWCHLMADTHQELIDFAVSIGLKQSWIQHKGRHTEHFDLRGKRMRDRAIAAGATPISGREMATLTLRKMEAPR